MKAFRFGYIQMHPGYDPDIHKAYFRNGEDETYIAAVDNIEQACRVAKQWADENKVDLIELCGAFGEAGAERVNKACQDRLPIGYATHSPSQNEKYQKLFGKEH